MFTTWCNAGKDGRRRYRRYSTGVAMRRLAFAWVTLHACTTHAGEPPWRNAPMHYFARNSQLSEVLKDVASAGGLSVDIAKSVKGMVNGTFDEPPANVFAKLTEAYGLAWYFDGKMLHVSAGSDIKTRTIPFAPMKREAVSGLLRSLDLDDPHLPVRYSDTTAKATGPSRFVDSIADAIEKARQQAAIETPFDQTQIRVFRLRYAQAQDITYTSGNRTNTVPGVASLLRKLMGDTYVPRPAARGLRVKEARPSRSGPPPLPSLRGLGLSGAADADAMLSPDPTATTQMEVTMPSDVTSARRNIVADARTNSVVVYDVPEMMPNYERAIAMLDQPQDLVEITAVVIDVATDAARDLGIRWGGGASGQDGAVYGMVNNYPTVGQSALSGVAGALQGVNLTTLIGNSVNYLFAQIRALEQSGKAHILSRPQVLTLNNSEAVLSSRNSVYVRVAGNQDVDLYNVDTGLTLKVTPTVESADDARKNILLNVQIEDGAFDTTQSVDGIPRVNNHSIVTQAIVADGESLLIGGYQYEKSETSRSQVPVLGDIPYVGALFGSTRTNSQRLERLILITPRLRRLNGGTPDAAPVPVAATQSASSPAPANTLNAAVAGALQSQPQSRQAALTNQPLLPAASAAGSPLQGQVR
ncbi:type III secretion system outer membrane ring subunit SctC [Paraburkholderia edwinii]|uniref:Type 3 secretion system secretin n=1 Tax=Paraburkholderia edwinii TaxID=2861782 RepID=A0ABX8UPB0_9BURK|nr:type III secretion system outer membrane ring subunit SctC [Paraburkholderia edwinii]QYD68829.1 type III secretion system outer membrane ring subunit SctC [Paraburkholderia edwinii]